MVRIPTFSRYKTIPIGKYKEMLSYMPFVKLDPICAYNYFISNLPGGKLSKIFYYCRHRIGNALDR